MKSIHLAQDNIQWRTFATKFKFMLMLYMLSSPRATMTGPPTNNLTTYRRIHHTPNMIQATAQHHVLIQSVDDVSLVFP